jgi:tRNA pseudouridine38-40 synthase
VHALGQVVSFDSETAIPPRVLLRALNAELPEDLIVFDVSLAPPGFHAIRDALRKRYRYVIEDGPLRDLFDRHHLWHIRQRLDVEAMTAAGKGLLGTHDFISYQSRGSSRLTTTRTVFDVLVERRAAERTERIIVEVEADGFLYNMVRNIVGTLVQVGKGKESVSWPREVLALRDRRKAGMTAPPEGLFLVEVMYGESPECGLASADCGVDGAITGNEDWIE